MKSIRLHIRRRGDGIDCRTEAIPQNAGHIEIEAQPSGDHGLKLKVSVLSGALSSMRQDQIEEAAEKFAALDGVDDANRRKSVISQWDHPLFLGSFSSVTQQSLLSIDRAGTVTRLAAPAKQGEAA